MDLSVTNKIVLLARYLSLHAGANAAAAEALLTRTCRYKQGAQPQPAGDAEHVRPVLARRRARHDELAAQVGGGAGVASCLRFRV